MSEDSLVLKEPMKAERRWITVASILRERIAKGDIRDGRDLSDIGLANEFQVSTAVVRQAVTQLVEEGLLTRQRGKGTFINKEPLEGGLKLESFDAWNLQGHTISVELLEARNVVANITVAAGLGVQVGQPAFYLKRLRCADGLPVALDYRYIPADLATGIDHHEFQEEAIWRVLQRTRGVQMMESMRTIKASAATQEAADILDVPPGSPVLHHEVQVLDTTGRVTILGTTVYHPDRFVYRTMVKANGRA